MNAPLPEHIRQSLETVTLDDKYSLDYGYAVMSGVQPVWIGRRRGQREHGDYLESHGLE